MAKDKPYMLQYRAMSGEIKNQAAEAVGGYNYKNGVGDPSKGFANDAVFERFVGDKWSGDSRPIRHPSTEAEIAQAEAFDVSLDNSSFDGAIYRGVAMPTERLKQYEVGDEIDMCGPASWSKAIEIAEGFSEKTANKRGGSRVVFHMPSGTKHGRDVSEASVYPSEQEVATSSKSRQRITEMYKHGEVTHFILTEI